MFAVEEVLEHLLDLRNTGGTSDKDDFVNLALSGFGILKHVLYRWHALAELWKAKLLELGTRDVDVKVFTISEGLAVDFRLMSS